MYVSNSTYSDDGIKPSSTSFHIAEDTVNTIKKKAKTKILIGMLEDHHATQIHHPFPMQDQQTIIQLVLRDCFKPVPAISATKTPYPSRLSIPAVSCIDS